MKITPWDGKPISKPGFYANIPMSAYHSGRLCDGPSLSSSGLRRLFMRSPAHFYDAWPLNPDYDADANAPNEGMILGRAAHHLLLGQPHFRKEFVKRPTECLDAKGMLGPWNGNKDGAKKWMAAQFAAGLTVLTPEQEQAVVGMAQRLSREPLIRTGALNGHVEITMAWRDAATNVWLLSRPDVIPTDSGDFTDLKTIGRGTVSYADIVHAIGEHGYHMQAALAAEGWRVLTGTPLASFSFYFIETKRPYCARMVQLKALDLQLGERQNHSAIERFVDCLNTGVWPGPGGTQEMVSYIDLSDRQRLAIEAELGREAQP